MLFDNNTKQEREHGVAPAGGRRVLHLCVFNSRLSGGWLGSPRPPRGSSYTGLLETAPAERERERALEGVIVTVEDGGAVAAVCQCVWREAHVFRGSSDDVETIVCRLDVHALKEDRDSGFKQIILYTHRMSNPRPAGQIRPAYHLVWPTRLCLKLG